MEENNPNDSKNLTQKEKAEVIQSWIDKYEIVKFVVKTTDKVYYLGD